MRIYWFLRSVLLHPSTHIVLAVIVGGMAMKNNPHFATFVECPYDFWQSWAVDGAVNIACGFLGVMFVAHMVKSSSRAKEEAALAKREADRDFNLRRRKAVLQQWREWFGSFAHSGDSDAWTVEIGKMYDEVSIAESWEFAFNDSVTRWLLRRGVEHLMCPIPELKASCVFVEKAIDIATTHQNWSALVPENTEAWRVIAPVLKERYHDLSRDYGSTPGFIEIDRLVKHGPPV